MKKEAILHCLWVVILVFVATGASKSLARNPIAYSMEDKTNYTSLIEKDIHACMESGIDGLVYDCFGSINQLPYCGSVVNGWARIADKIGATQFLTFISFDMSGSNATTPPAKLSAAALVASMLAIVNNTHYFRVDGKPVLSTYAGRILGDSWWNQSVIQPLKDAGHPIYFVPNFDRPNPNFGVDTVAAFQTTVIDTFPSIDGSYNFLAPAAPPFDPSDTTDMGPNHWYSLITYNLNFATALSQAGKYYLWPVMPSNYDECHSARQYTETKGGLGIASQWQTIMTNLSLVPAVYLITWNDYTEGTSFSPSTYNPLPTQARGGQTLQHIGYYELQKYYIFWYKNLYQPSITNDAVFYFHRLQPFSANATNDTCPIRQPGPPGKGSQIWGDIQDAIWITTALTSPATLLVISGGTTHTYQVPAGVHHTGAPFVPGKQEIKLQRGGDTVIDTYSADITATPTDYNYNVYSGYYVAGGDNSATWRPSARWKDGFMASWFSASGPSVTTGNAASPASTSTSWARTLLY